MQMAWEVKKETVRDSVHRFQFMAAGGNVLRYADVLSLWESAEPEGHQFRTCFVNVLRESDFRAFKWETPVVDAARLNREFEFVLLDTPELERRASQTAFADQFADSDVDSIITFNNLGRNAVLVVPTPTGNPKLNACHLASFVRTADPEQVDQLWRSVAAAMLKRVSNKPVWLSTAGGGVPWLHVRLDDRPKYYGYSKYREV